MKRARIILKKGREDSLQRRHPWIFSGAIAKSEGNPEEGELVDVISSDGTIMGTGHCQIGSIAVRMLTFSAGEIDDAWWTARISRAYELRRTSGLAGSESTTCYRLVHGEGDGLPGLIVDIYGSTAVVQCHSVGMYVSREQITSALQRVLGNSLLTIYDKSSQTVPFNAGLEAEDGYLLAPGNSLPDNCEVRENNLRFLVNWEKGQKTGFFLDQRDNRQLISKYSAGKRVLNTFCYTGGFSVYALAGGAQSVDSVDSSSRAMELTDANVALNFGSLAPHESITADAMKFLRESQNQYDLIILDPPAFAKHQNALRNAIQGYRRLNTRAMEMLPAGGLLFTFSCSQAVSREAFRTMIFSAASSVGRNVRILHQLTQPSDHPISIYHPEGEYLKGLVLEIE